MYRTYGQCSSMKIPPPILDYENNLVIEEMPCDNTRDPKIWGPIWWFSLFNGCCAADESIPRAERAKYWQFIQGLPVMLPCSSCKEHAQAFIQKHAKNKDTICASRKSLLKFFVDFHNAIGKRKGNKKVSVQDVEKKFLTSGPVNALRISYM